MLKFYNRKKTKERKQISKSWENDIKGIITKIKHQVFYVKII